MNTLLSRIRAALSRDNPSLKLYQMEYCFYCRKVVREAKKLGVSIAIVDIFADRQAREHLQTHTGKTRVPVLGILGSDGVEKFLPESEDIIRYLREEAEKSSKARSAPDPTPDSFGVALRDPGKASSKDQTESNLDEKQAC